MSTFIAVVFDNEAKAKDAAAALTSLHDAGVITVYGSALITKLPNGSIDVKEKTPQGPITASLGALIGGLVGLFGGVPGIAVGASAGALLGSWRDLATQGMHREFIETVGRHLSPGKTAVLLEAIEDDRSLVDDRMSRIGGEVLRESRAEAAEEPIFNELAERKAELASLKAECVWSSGEAKHQIEERIQKLQTTIREVADRARTHAEGEVNELDAKLRLLEARAAASGNDHAVLDQAIADLRAQRERQSSRVKETAY